MKRILVLIAALVVAGTTVSATELCGTATLQTYITDGACTLGGELFSNWNFVSGASVGVTPYTASDVNVLATYDGIGQITFTFSPVTGPAFIGADSSWSSFYITYDVTGLRAMLSTTLGIGPATTDPPGHVTVDECTGATALTPTSTGGRYSCSPGLDYTHTGNTPGGSTSLTESLASPTSQWFLSTVDVGSNNPAHGAASGSGQVQWFSNTINFTPEEPSGVPEPAAFGLVGLGLLALRFFRR